LLVTACGRAAPKIRALAAPEITPSAWAGKPIASLRGRARRNSPENGFTDDAMMKVQIGTLCAKFYVEQLRELPQTAPHRGM
jgi:hypothetical protein